MGVFLLPFIRVNTSWRSMRARCRRLERAGRNSQFAKKLSHGHHLPRKKAYGLAHGDAPDPTLLNRRGAACHPSGADYVLRFRATAIRTTSPSRKARSQSEVQLEPRDQ
jgi:hypothetical protein